MNILAEYIIEYITEYIILLNIYWIYIIEHIEYII